jgi:hypothetical protein
LEAELAQARAENAALKVQIVELEQRLAEWERVGKRQATPFVRAEHTADPKKPGRKAGQGLCSYRTNRHRSSTHHDRVCVVIHCVGG